jgi:hypothetical protein
MRRCVICEEGQVQALSVPPDETLDVCNFCGATEQGYTEEEDDETPLS